MPESYDQAALRHFADSDALALQGRFDGAGHLIGFAVECAIKHSVVVLRPGQGVPHVHLPDLVERAKKSLQGRRKSAIHTVIERPGFMNGWDVAGRYSRDGEIHETTFRSWRDDAGRALSAAGLRRSKT